jgi:predicted phosphohydrolase
VSICGTRGWTLEPSDEDEKVLNREVGRLKMSLQQAEKTPVVFLHYPPVFGDLRCEPILDVLKEFNVKECYYGHLHGSGATNLAVQGTVDGIEFRLISADHLDFTPLKIRE